jgi:hypothetical protein
MLMWQQKKGWSNQYKKEKEVERVKEHNRIFF